MVLIFDPERNRNVNITNEYGAPARRLYRIYINDLNQYQHNILPRDYYYNEETDRFVRFNNLYGRTAKKKYADAIDNGANPQDFLPPNLIYNRLTGRFRRVPPPIDRTNTLLLNYLFVRAQQPNPETYIKNLLRTYNGQTIKLVRRYHGGNEAQLTLPNFRVASFYKNHNNFLYPDSDTFLFGDEMVEDMILSGDFTNNEINKENQLLILTFDKVNANLNFNQYFLDGVNHCFFHPIKEWAEGCEEGAKSPSAKKRYKTIIKNCDKYIEKYATGIPLDDMQNVCDKMQIQIKISIPSETNKTTKIHEFIPPKKPLKSFEFINTRLNHLELNKNVYMNKYQELDNDEMDEKFNELDENNDYFIYKQTMDNDYSKITTLNGTYILKDEYRDIVREFEKKNNLNAYKIDYFKDKDLSSFLGSALKENRCIDPHGDMTGEDTDDYNHIDMTRAYTKSKDAPFYEGFMGKITDFRKCNKIMGTGLYMVDNVNFNGNELIPMMRCFRNGNIYSSPELKYYSSLGITYDIIMGAWGQKSIHLDFNIGENDEENNANMFKKIKGVRVYCKWFGCLYPLNFESKYIMKCDNEEYASMLSHYKEDDNTSFYQNKWTQELMMVIKKKENVFHYRHIASFITSYQRLSILQQLSKLPLNSIKRICVDGIYYDKNINIEPDKNFSFKDGKTFNNSPSRSYTENDNFKEEIEYCDNFNVGEYKDNHQHEVHLGGGGCGKTHHNLTDKGLRNILFSAPSWKLARNKKENYGCDATTWTHHLLTKDPEIWQPLYNNYSVIICDEISMMSNHKKNLIIKRFNQHKIIFCGDLGYQLDPVYDQDEIDKGNDKKENFKVGKIKTIYHKINYRCECDILKNNLNYLRQMIDNKSNIKEIFDKIKIVDKDNIDYKIDDLIITRTHKNKDVYTEKYQEFKKWYVLANNRDYSNGMIVIQDEKPKIKCEIRHAFTIHAIQGETAQTRLFIDINNMYDLKMLYTAISRAKKWNQIIFMK